MIDPDDVEITYVRIKPDVNCGYSGAVLRHLPTGIQVQSLEVGGRFFNLHRAAQLLVEKIDEHQKTIGA
jgi:protein subunit release factor A